MKISSRALLVALGWAVFQGHFQFSVLINKGDSVHPLWYPMILVVSVLACSLYGEVEEALRYWILSIAFSLLIVFVLLYTPILLGVLDPQLAPLIIAGSLQPISIAVVLLSSISLLGCFLGQVLRNRYL